MTDIEDRLNDAIVALAEARNTIRWLREQVETLSATDDPHPTQCPHCDGQPGEEGYLPLRRHPE